MKGTQKIVYFPGGNSAGTLYQGASNPTATSRPVSSSDSDPADADQFLLQQITQHSNVALAQLYRKYEPCVMAFAMSQLAREWDCREIVNDVFLTVWHNADRFEGRSTIRTWMLGITRHKIIDAIRKQRRQRFEGSDYPDQNPSEALTLDHQIMILEDNKAIKYCIGRLSPAHRAVIHLSFYQDLSCSEIAEVLECPMGTVKTRLMHARANLKRMLLANSDMESLF